MPSTTARSALVYRYHERFFRLALLLGGDASTAAALLEAAFRELPPNATPDDAEPALARALLAQRLPRRRWSFRPAEITHTGLDAAAANALLGVLAALTPLARLQVGLALLGGHSAADTDALLGTFSAAAALADLRQRAAPALGLVPAGAEPAALARLDRWAEGQMSDDEQLAMRRDLLADPALRELRDGVLAVRELLPRAVPALFAAAPPLALTERLLELVDERPAMPQAPGRRRAQLGLAAGILLLAAAIVAVPSWLASRAAAPAASLRPSITSPAALLAAALHRFEQPALQSGVLHEVYRVQNGGEADILIERWYDYAAPHRLAITVTPEGIDAAPLLQIASDGKSIAQFRYDGQRAFGAQSADVQLAPAEAAAIVPLLRGQPQESIVGRDSQNQPSDPGPLFLAQAREIGATQLGQTTLLGRPAVLLTYTTTQLPEGAPSDAPVRVILTIDAQTYALLDVAVLAEGAAESTAERPLRAQQFELLADAPADAPFTLPDNTGVVQRIGMGSVRFPFVDRRAQLTIEDAAQRENGELLAPLQLPADHMRGLAFQNGGRDNQVILLYEGEFQNVLLLPRFNPRGSQSLGAEQTAGTYRYRVMQNESSASITALVYHPDTPEQGIGLILNDTFSTAAERQASLQALIASLTPVNEQSLPLLRAQFAPPESTAGHSE
jgi:hypothetical protein